MENVCKDFKIKLTDKAPKGVNVIRVTIHYDLGGYNVFTGKERPRGYYVTVTPCEIKGACITTTAFSGYTSCIVKCNRKSKLKERLAAEIAPDIIKELIVSLGIYTPELIQGNLDTLIAEGIENG